MKILHIASFAGNIGDIANHYGFRKWFNSLFKEDLIWNEFEIRETFRGVKSFDEDFVNLANKNDLLIFGGGGFFELWLEDSPTGTSISISREILKKIKVPIFFNGLGSCLELGHTEKTISRFKNFIEYLSNRSDVFISFRNDGTKNDLTKLIPDLNDLKNIKVVPDGGFFAYENTQKNHKNNNKFTRIGINIAKDMNDIRFPEKSINYEEYLMEMKKFLILISKDIKNLEIMFFPHIWSDMNIIGDLLSILPDEIRREKTIVSELCCFKKHKDTIFKDYLKCDYILATRFHSNIISLSNHIPTIAMINCNQIRGLYREIGLENYTLDVRKINFSEEGILKFKDLKNNNNIFKEQIHIKMNYIINQLEEFKTSLNSWLKIVNLKKL